MDIDRKFSQGSHKVLLEGSVSQICDLGPSALFYIKNRVTFCNFFQYQFLHFIKLKLGLESKFLDTPIYI